ncbi:uncharacterized protein B0T15DRAFT_568536 [Chaetomium strumarium]|uniref:Uncharacterized protein n=1 Tax=Chaetomium strumarium TaxID=1170767 RepID=A0AAJ0M0U7_9PEZI|nr:hypothetical protein B0T15DRAFT_568536 [Chaetomium strumarium]
MAYLIAALQKQGPLTLLRGVRSYREYLDLVISYREKEYQVYRAIIYIQSEFFAIAYKIDRDRADINRLAIGALATHIRIYALAEKYLIRRLKTVAVRKFKAEVTIPFRSLDIYDFIHAMEVAYTSTIEDDRSLRDVVVETLYKHPHWLDKEEVRDVMKELGALMYDFIIYMRQKGRI